MNLGFFPLQHISTGRTVYSTFATYHMFTVNHKRLEISTVSYCKNTFI